jgi:GT2 family glycosyltransferase
MIDVSVVIVNWNTRRLLLDCIQSILSETTEHKVEIIVVDNDSHDGSAEAVEREFPACCVIRNSGNAGFAAANNLGIAASSGRYVCLVNSDVVLLDGCLDRICVYMDQHLVVGMIGPQILNRDLTLQRSVSGLPTVWNVLMQALFLDRLFPRVRWFHSRFTNVPDLSRPSRVEVLSGCFLMVRGEALHRVGPLDERFFMYKEDVDWCKRFGEAGWSVVFYPESRAIHYGGASSSKAPARFMLEMEKANIQYWKKHHSTVAEKIVRLISGIHYGIRLLGWAMTYLVRQKSRVNAANMVKKNAVCLSWLSGFGRGPFGDLSRL